MKTKSFSTIVTGNAAARCNSRISSLRLPSRLSHTTNSAGRASGVILPMIAAMLLLAAAPRMGWAQSAPNNIIFDGTDTHCGDACCLKFTDTINQQTSNIDIVLIGAGYGSGPSCLDYSCWQGQGIPGVRTFDHGPLGDTDFEIVAGLTDPMYIGPFPQILTVYICGSYDCLQQYELWEGQTSLTGTNVETYGPNPLNEESCAPIPGGCDGCSYLTVEPAPPGPFPQCGNEICFFNQSGSYVNSFTVNIYPPIDWSDPCGGLGGGGGVRCPLSTTYDQPFFTYSGCEQNGGWTVTQDDYGNITFTANDPLCGVQTCSGPFCFFIPYCNNLKPRVVTLIDPGNPPTCNPDYTSIHVGMKEINGNSGLVQSNSGGQNYPNPVDAVSGFNTTIPFVTSAGGVALITLSDDKGSKVLSDDEDILGPGQHFFYFSAKDLPSGTYYYTIEFPQGVVIANKTMIVVK